MLRNTWPLIKAVPLVIFTVILFVHICYDFENKFTRNYVPATANLSSISWTRNTVKIKFRHCKALFSLESPAPEEKIGYIYTEKILPNETVGDVLHRKEGTKKKEEVTGIYRDINDVLKKILNLKYSEPEKYLDEAYHLLSELLPGVAEYDSPSENERESQEQQNQSRNEPKRKTDRRTKHVKQRTSSRIVEGTLPFVPCSIRGYEDKRQVFTCFQKRIDVQGSLSIHFFGDSKIRFLVHQFLKEADDVFHFVIVEKLVLNQRQYNITRPWPDAKSDLIKDFKWIDFEVITPALPRLQITFREVYSPFCAGSKTQYRCFYLFFYIFRKFMNSPDIRRDLPEIRQLKKWANYEETPPDLLIIDYTAWALTLHTDDKVIPQATRHTTDVLAVLLEMHAKVVPLLDKISKRTRVLVLSQSRMKLDVENLLMNYRGAMADFNMDWSEATFLYILKHYHHLNRPLLESRRAKAKEMLRISEDYVEDYKAQMSQSADMNPSAIWYFFQGVKKAENESSSSSKLSYSAQSKKGSPGSDADIFSRYPQVAREKLKKAPETTPFRDYLIPSTEESGLWFWDTLIPFSLAEIRECHEMFERGYGNQPFYKGSARRCNDPTHSGDITNSDLVTMMLNLLCNTVLEAEGDYCCS
ncbi:LOW QUALITY PROTEIN: uncharacterized protein LOC135200727 [Macrobrachium nipponense]|uniref:LOW QUALITY PROTEIN: uncharacterized protein LOC135200727 n=1 Tax=Macrobrachium nipponense TaxID=159736 RepID=UPI0030C84E6F